MTGRGPVAEVMGLISCLYKAAATWLWVLISFQETYQNSSSQSEETKSDQSETYQCFLIRTLVIQLWIGLACTVESSGYQKLYSSLCGSVCCAQ